MICRAANSALCLGSGGGALIGWKKTPTRDDWLLLKGKHVVGRLRRILGVGVRERYTFASMKTGRSLSLAVDVVQTGGQTTRFVLPSDQVWVCRL